VDNLYHELPLSQSNGIKPVDRQSRSDIMTRPANIPAHSISSLFQFVI